MSRILNYIKNGKGCGMKFLLLYSFIISLIFAFEIKSLGNYFVPEMQNMAEKFLPVKIENGAIVEPNNEIKSVDFKLDGEIFPVVLDTTVDTIEPIGLKPGIYIARKALYAIGNDDIRVVNFKQDIELPMGNYINVFKRVVLCVAIFGFVLGWLTLFIGYTLCSIIYAFCGQFIAKVRKFTLDFVSAMRLAVTAYLPTLLLALILGFFALKLNFWMISAAVLILEYIIISAILTEDKQENPKSVKKTKKVNKI